MRKCVCTYLPLQTPGRKEGLPRLWAQRCGSLVADISPAWWSYRAASSPVDWLNTDWEKQRQETENEGKKVSGWQQNYQECEVSGSSGKSHRIFDFYLIWFHYGVFRGFISQSVLFPQNIFANIGLWIFFFFFCNFHIVLHTEYICPFEVNIFTSYSCTYRHFFKHILSGKKY